MCRNHITQIHRGRLQGDTDWNNFFYIFGGHQSFLWGHSYLYFGLLVMSGLDFKARMDHLACIHCHPCVMDSSDSRFTFGATPADLLMANMVAEPFQSMYLHTSITGAQVQNQVSHCLTVCNKSKFSGLFFYSIFVYCLCMYGNGGSMFYW